MLMSKHEEKHPAFIHEKSGKHVHKMENDEIGDHVHGYKHLKEGGAFHHENGDMDHAEYKQGTKYRAHGGKC
jgi:hypothetical protein